MGKEGRGAGHASDGGSRKAIGKAVLVYMDKREIWSQEKRYLYIWIRRGMESGNNVFLIVE